MRVPFTEVFKVERTADGYALAESRPVRLKEFCAIRLEAEIKRVANPQALAARFLEVEETPDGEWEIEGFAAAEAR